MKNTCLVTLLLAGFFFNISKGQNLVPNPSFEDTVQCPNLASQIERAAGWSSYLHSPDYYNVCDTNPFFGVPSNYYGGYQQPATGVAYAGIECYATNAFYHEIFGIQLTQPLIIGQEYYCAFKASMGVGYLGFNNAACDKLGFRFATFQHNYLTNPISIDNVSQVYTNTIIMDTLNWTLVSGCFIADSAYQYVAIGVFFEDINLNIINFNSPSDAGVYYYIDDVFVGIDSVSCSNVNTISIPGELQKVKVFPNPFVNEINVLSKETHLLEGSIYDCTSRLVKTQTIYPGYNKLDTSNLDIGIYSLLVVNKNSDTLKYKLIKVKF